VVVWKALQRRRLITPRAGAIITVHALTLPCLCLVPNPHPSPPPHPRLHSDELVNEDDELGLEIMISGVTEVSALPCPALGLGRTRPHLRRLRLRCVHCPPPAARCLELQTTQSTLMLKKKKEMRAVDDALDFMKEEFRKRMEACDEREARFKDKQAEMKAMVGVLSSEHCPPFAPYVAAAAPCRAAAAAATVAVDGGIGTTELATVVTFPTQHVHPVDRC
jgi:hypothetical protein